MDESTAAVKVLIKQRDRTPWFWNPQMHWFGWKTLLPLMVGHDEYARRTIVIGWTVTGRAIFPLWDCGDPACHTYAIQTMMWDEDD